MVARLKLWLIVPLLLMGLLAPKVSAVLLDLHPRVEVAVICSGSQIVTDGAPVQTEDIDVPCVLADFPLMAEAGLPDWVTLARSYPTPFVAIPSGATRHDARLLNRDSQAPRHGCSPLYTSSQNLTGSNA
ncbi:MAG: hypothetical protein AAFS08_17565 [Pseudomonadota bacterium]